jgi:hypothetical protein
MPSYIRGFDSGLHRHREGTCSVCWTMEISGKVETVAHSCLWTHETVASSVAFSNSASHFALQIMFCKSNVFYLSIYPPTYLPTYLPAYVPTHPPLFLCCWTITIRALSHRTVNFDVNITCSFFTVGSWIYGGMCTTVSFLVRQAVWCMQHSCI